MNSASQKTQPHPPKLSLMKTCFVDHKTMRHATPQFDSSSRPAQIEQWMPGVQALRTYQRGWLPRDLITGLVLCTLLVPQGMAYAGAGTWPRLIAGADDYRLM